jgi:hypothetical protein
MNGNYMSCKTCNNNYNERNLKGCKYYLNCLKRFGSLEKIRDYIHPKYPDMVRLYNQYKYIYWEPMDNIRNYVLTDKDFEL